MTPYCVTMTNNGSLMSFKISICHSTSGWCKQMGSTHIFWRRGITEQQNVCAYVIYVWGCECEWGDDCWFQHKITLKWDAAAAAAAPSYEQEGEDVSTGQRSNGPRPSSLSPSPSSSFHWLLCFCQGMESASGIDKVHYAVGCETQSVQTSNNNVGLVHHIM